jgi:hypothetical protein
MAVRSLLHGKAHTAVGQNVLDGLTDLQGSSEQPLALSRKAAMRDNETQRVVAGR